MATRADICRNRHGGADTSQLAFKFTPQTVRDGQSRKVLAWIMLWGPVTCDAIEVGTGLSHQSVSARISELKRDGLIRISGRGRTRSGRTARLYVGSTE